MTLSAYEANFDHNAGNGSVEVTARASLSYNALNSDTWIHLTSGTRYKGSATVTFTVDANAGADRAGGIIIEKKYFRIHQSSPCPNCSGDTPLVQNVTFTSGSVCECVGGTSITIGPGVTIEKDAKATFTAPTVDIQSGFHAENGSTVNVQQ